MCALYCIVVRETRQAKGKAMGAFLEALLLDEAPILTLCF